MREYRDRRKPRPPIKPMILTFSMLRRKIPYYVPTPSQKEKAYFEKLEKFFLNFFEKRIDK